MKRSESRGSNQARAVSRRKTWPELARPRVESRANTYRQHHAQAEWNESERPDRELARLPRRGGRRRPRRGGRRGRRRRSVQPGAAVCTIGSTIAVGLAIAITRGGGDGGVRAFLRRGAWAAILADAVGNGRAAPSARVEADGVLWRERRRRGRRVISRAAVVAISAVRAPGLEVAAVRPIGEQSAILAETIRGRADATRPACCCRLQSMVVLWDTRVEADLRLRFGSRQQRGENRFAHRWSGVRARTAAASVFSR